MTHYRTGEMCEVGSYLVTSLQLLDNLFVALVRVEHFLLAGVEQHLDALAVVGLTVNCLSLSSPLVVMLTLNY